jgi:Rrf2 family protein
MSQSTRFAVAVHVAVLLAEFGGKPATSAQIARSVNTNPVVVRRVLGALAAAGLAESERGASGGSRLARPAGKITLRDLYRAVGEGELCPLHDIGRSPGCPVARAIGPVLSGIVERASSAMEDELGRTTLADVVAQVKAKVAKTAA